MNVIHHESLFYEWLIFHRIQEYLQSLWPSSLNFELICPESFSHILFKFILLFTDQPWPSCWWIIMTHTFSPRCFHRVSIVSFPGDFFWEDLVVLRRTVVVALPLSIDLPLSTFQMVWHQRMFQVIIRRLFTGGQVHGQGSLSGLIIIILVPCSVPLSSGLVCFQSQFHH